MSVRRAGGLPFACLLAAWLPGGAFAACASGTTAFFSPWDDVEAVIIDSLDAAQAQVLAQAYLLTSRNIARALREAAGRGVDVRVLADAGQFEHGADRALRELAKAGVPVALEMRYAAAHNKVLLIDATGPAPVLLTGSYNFTWAAQARNAENVLRVCGDPALAARYAANWQRHCLEAKPLGGPAGARPLDCRLAPGSPSHPDDAK